MENNEKRRPSREGECSGLIFVACMFIGGGLGLAFGEAAVGWLLGMGVGFLLMGLVGTRKTEPTPVTIGLPRGVYRIVLAMIGIFIIICGLALLYRYTVAMLRYLPAIALVAVGVIVLIASFGGGSKSSSSST